MAETTAPIRVSALAPCASTWRRRARRGLILLGASGALLLALYSFRAPILTAIAKAYVVNEPIEKADAVVALGGGLQYRTFEAARIYHAGLAPKVLIIRAKLAP